MPSWELAARKARVLSEEVWMLRSVSKAILDKSLDMSGIVLLRKHSEPGGARKAGDADDTVDTVDATGATKPTRATGDEA